MDDGAEDSSGAILDDYANKDKRIKVIHQTNHGVGYARNVGLETAIGEWVLFFDADDLWHKSLLASISHADKGYNLIRFGAQEFSEKCNFAETEFRVEHIVRGTGVTYDDYVQGLWQYAFKRDLIADTRFKPWIRGEDKLFLFEILSRVNRIEVVTGRLYGYRNNPKSAIHSGFSADVIDSELGFRTDIIQYCKRNAILLNEKIVNDFTHFLLFWYLPKVFKLGRKVRDVFFDKFEQTTRDLLEISEYDTSEMRTLSRLLSLPGRRIYYEIRYCWGQEIMLLLAKCKRSVKERIQLIAKKGRFMSGG